MHLASKTTYKIYNIHKLHQSAPPQASGRQDPRGCPLRGWPHARHRGAARVSLPEWKYLSNSGIVFLFHSCNIRFVWDLWSQSKFHDMCSGVIPLASSTLKQTMTTAMDMRLWCIVKNKLQIQVSSHRSKCGWYPPLSATSAGIVQVEWFWLRGEDFNCPRPVTAKEK